MLLVGVPAGQSQVVQTSGRRAWPWTRTLREVAATSAKLYAQPPTAFPVERSIRGEPMRVGVRLSPGGRARRSSCRGCAQRTRHRCKSSGATASTSLPVLYLHGLSTGDFEPALRDLLGEDASGLSSASISRLTKAWQAEHEQFRTCSLRFHRYACLFIDGVHVSVCLGEDDRLCLLVVIGVREDGVKELLAVEDGYRESTDSWAGVLRDLRKRGLNEPRLVTGDGALGAWAALRDVFPQAGEQRCWVHKIANVLDALPKRLQPRAKTLLHQMMEAPTEADARAARETFRTEFAAKYPKAIDKLDRDWRALTAFYSFPAEHWRHLRTTNPIESSFATVKLRTRVTKGAGSKAAALGMAFKLLKTAEERWRRFNGHELVADVLAGAHFTDGIRVPDEHPNQEDEKVAA